MRIACMHGRLVWVDATFGLRQGQRYVSVNQVHVTSKSQVLAALASTMLTACHKFTVFCYVLHWVCLLLTVIYLCLQAQSLSRHCKTNCSLI